VAFARDLRDHGITVRGQLRETSAPRGAQVLATVSSPTVAEIVEHTLAVSDNEAAEVLLRQVALATGRTPSFTGGVVAVRQVLSRRGLDMSGVVLHDGSGLSRDNRVPLETLVDLLELAEETPRLRPMVTDLPVAGFSGSLGYRFAAPGSRPGRGLVRAKTGTLSQVHLLAGSVLVAGGTVLTFALAADRVRVADTLAARDAMDRVAGALADCGCS
jgi:D-alanyl-D-alanine carboxypeptidase/D-alanyl-D-alanine-endopeptidase (penicillin-binding protein 4)